MHSLISLRQLRIPTILMLLTILAGCGEGDGPTRILNEPAAPFAGPPDSCFEALTFEDICDQPINFIEFEGAPGRTVDNPDQSGINTSAKVAEFVKLRAASGATFGGTIVDFSAIGSDDISPGDFITVKVWSQRPVNVLVEPEGGGPGSGEEVAHGGTGWELLTFNFNFSGSTSGYVFIFDNGTNGDGGNDPLNWTFYADDISVPMSGGGGPVGTTLPVDFEADPATYDFGVDGGFEGGAASVIANPDISGINTSAQVGQMQKFPGAVFGGATLAIEPTTVEAGSSFTMKVWSQRGVNVLLQPEPQGPGSGIEVAHGGTGWEELTFSLPGLSGTVSGLTLIFDNGTAGAADTDPTNWTFYFDDITLVPPGGGGGPTGTTLPVDFEADPATYDFGVDGGFEGGAASVIANPDISGINTSAQVGQMQKFPGAVFGGATLAIEPTTVEAGSSFTMKVWSQRGVNVLLQPEPQGPGSGIEVAHGGTGWEELTFSLPGLSGTVSGLTLIFDNGTAGAADTDPTNWTFYFDDITLVPPGGGGGAAELLTNGDLGGGQSGWIGQATVVDDGGNFVLQGVVTSPDPGQPFLVNASQVVTLTQDETYTLTFRAKASEPRTMLAGIGLNVDPFTSVVETVPLTTDWLAYTYTLTANGFGGADSRVLFDMNAEAGDVFIDDVSLTVGSLLTNGDMEAGQDSWINQATVVDDGGNLVLQGVVTNPDPAQPFLVNASQVVSLVADEQYVLTFKARASVDRGMIVGIGLNVDPFTNTADTVALTTAWETYTCTLASTGFGGDDSRVLFDMNAEAGDVFIDDVALALLGPTGSDTVEGCVGGVDAGGGGDGELLTNGDMEAGQEPWIGQGAVVDDGGNFVLQGVVTSPDPGQPFLVNASQVVTLTQDETYTLTFRARATVPRTMLAGIGLNVDPFTAVTETVPLDTDWQAYTYTLTATGFGGADSRVLFDMNAEAGDVFIDDVSLTVGSLLTNGDMEAGQAPWIGQATVVDDGGNFVLQGVVTNPDPGQPFLVNASQVLTLTADETYVLTFKARASVARSMLAGLGLNVDPFTAVTETVALTTDWQAFTYTITTTGFGGADSRVLFDMNAEAGDVFIDDVALALLGPTGGGGGGGGAGDDIAVNGGFEAGDFSGWTQFPQTGTQAIVTTNPSEGTFAANLGIPTRTAGDPGVDNLIKNANLEAGSLTPNSPVTVTWDMRGSLVGAGGVVFVELFSEVSGGGATGEIYTGGPIFPDADSNVWTSYTWDTNLGADVSGGVTLQLKVGCGDVEGCGADIFFDNITIVIN